MTTRKLVVNDGQTEKELLIVGTVSIGRDPSCNIHSLDPLLSRRHAEFAWSKPHVTIRDLDSRNGILVNGIKVREQILKTGDVVQAGGLQLRYLETSTINSEEEHTRARERTDTAVETPTLAPTGHVPARPPAAATPAASRAASQADTVTARVVPGVDLDATFAGSVADRTFAPGSLDPGSLGAQGGNFDATLAPVRRPSVASPASPAAATSAAPVEAQIVVDRQLLVTSASAGCFELFGVRPEALVGGSAAEVLLQSLTTVAAPGGPPGLSIALSRSGDRTLTLTFKAGQAVETVR
jgi:pSer/pThr/pTyr-binding forkhead associated (FHA) protein